MASTHARRIVSSFLTLGTPHTPSFRVALFHRRPDRSVYPNLWAAVSGKIESTDATPLAAAWREIKEETGLEEVAKAGLNAPGLELVREGGKIDLEDAKLGRRWEIWTFVFRMRGLKEGQEGRAAEAVRLDEEHDEVRFVSLEEMRGMSTVDRLEESLRRTLGEKE